MTNHTITIFDKSYVNFQRVPDENVPLGFMTFYEDKAPAAFKQRKRTIDNLALNRGAPAATMNGVIIDNNPMIGFRISRSLRRLGWSSKSTFIRIEDPRGFEIDISIANMIMLTDNNLLENGEILRPCVWGRDGNTNVLLPINSKPYTQALENTERLNTHVNVRTIHPGDSVILKNGKMGIYMGTLYASSWSHSGGQYSGFSNNRNANITTIMCDQNIKYHYIREVDSQNRIIYSGYKSLSASSVTARNSIEPEKINLLILDDMENNSVIINSPVYSQTIILTTQPATVSNVILTPISHDQLKSDYDDPVSTKFRDTFYGSHKTDKSLYRYNTSNMLHWVPGPNATSRRYIANIGYVDDNKWYGCSASIENKSITYTANDTEGYDYTDLDLFVLSLELNISKLNQTLILTK